MCAGEPAQRLRALQTVRLLPSRWRRSFVTDEPSRGRCVAHMNEDLDEDADRKYNDTIQVREAGCLRAR